MSVVETDFGLNPNEFDGLVSFEEINDYTLLENVKVSGHDKYIIKKSKKKNNRKNLSAYPGEEALNYDKENAAALEDIPNSYRKSTKRKNDFTQFTNSSKKSALEVDGKSKKSASKVDAKSKKSASKVDAKSKKSALEVDAKPKKSTLKVDVKSWRAIFTPECVIKAIKELGFQEPTSIQRLTIPAAIKAHRDIVGAAETGSGKTLAFIIPIIHGILRDKEKEDSIKNLHLEDEDEYSGDCAMAEVNGVIDSPNCTNENTRISLKKKKLRALIVTPTRELAVQIKNHADAVLTKTNIKTAVVIGGLSSKKQERMLMKFPEIVIGTPGRLWELFCQEHPHLCHLSEISFLVVDETDRMLEKGTFIDLQRLLEKINGKRTLMEKRQNFVFSATLTLTHGPPERLKNRRKQVIKVDSKLKLSNIVEMIGVRPNPKTVDITRKVGTVETLSESKILCDEDEKDGYLFYFLSCFPGRTLIFCNSISCVRRLYNLLNLLRCKPLTLHASKVQKQRLKSLEHFTKNPKSVLLATDVAARGLDIPGVDHIIHYETPRTAEIYVHRSGRTARANQKGLSVLLVGPTEVTKYHKLCQTLNRSMELPSFPLDAATLKQVRERVQLAHKVETMIFTDGNKKKTKSWFHTMAEAADIEFSGSDLDADEQPDKVSKIQRRSQELKYLKSELARLLSRPLVSHMFSEKFPTSTGALVMPILMNHPDAKSDAIEALHQHKKTMKLPLPSLNMKRNRKRNKKVKA